MTKTSADIKAGKRTEDALADDIKQFDALLAQHQGEKTDAVAQILLMKAMLYSEVIGNTDKGDALIKQLKSDFKDTHCGQAGTAGGKRRGGKKNSGLAGQRSRVP